MMSFFINIIVYTKVLLFILEYFRNPMEMNKIVSFHSYSLYFRNIPKPEINLKFDNVHEVS